jgi:FPC/CPF motif-containing protein YcgG
MKAILEDYLIKVNQEIVQYSIRDDDEKYKFLINKAVEYRNTISKINELLNH